MFFRKGMVEERVNFFFIICPKLAVALFMNLKKL